MNVVEASPLLYTESYTVTDKVFVSDRPPTSAGTKVIFNGSEEDVRMYLSFRYTSVFWAGYMPVICIFIDSGA